ncbi:MAG: response regulator transcription factor [Deltaproteobacteria bacterium]|nr:response regulator transcription factor [Deltaproteobacteria bacterium]
MGVLSPAALGDILVLDLSLPMIPGAEVLTRVREKHPAVRIIVLSMYAEEHYAARMLRAGARMYLAKTRPPEDVVAAVVTVAEGRDAPQGLVASPESPRVQLPHERLSEREHQVFMLLVQGAGVGDIAVGLNLAASTVSNHLARIREKLGAKSNAEVIRYAFVAGLNPE